MKRIYEHTESLLVKLEEKIMGKGWSWKWRTAGKNK